MARGCAGSFRYRSCCFRSCRRVERAGRLPLLAAHDGSVTVRPFTSADGRRVGVLRPIGAVTLSGSDPAFGSRSAMAIRGDRITLLSDGGNHLSFGLRGGGRSIRAADSCATGRAPAGSRRSRQRIDDARSGHERVWAGFERANAIWRYSADLSHARGAPQAARDAALGTEWRTRIARPADRRAVRGDFRAIAGPGASRGVAVRSRSDRSEGDGAPVLPICRPPDTIPATRCNCPAALLILNRRYRFPLRFDARLVRVPLDALTFNAFRGR